MELPKELHQTMCEGEKKMLSSLYYKQRQLERAIKKYSKKRVINSARVEKIGVSHGFPLGGTEKKYR